MKNVKQSLIVCIARDGQGCKFILCLILCVFLFLTACGKNGSSDNAIMDHDAVTGESAVLNSKQEREWVYVPEVIVVGDEHADYGRMLPVGDDFCYVSMGEENNAKSICRYSMTDGKLTSVPINWPEGGNSWDVGYRLFTEDYGLYMTANVYPADSGSMKRFLCKMDSEGNCLFSKDITEQAGRDVSLRRMAADRQGRLYIFLDNGEILLYTGEGDYYGSVSLRSSESQPLIQIKGACEGADGKFYVCISQESTNLAERSSEEAGGRCSLMEIDFENIQLAEIAGNLPNINGLCMGIWQGDNSDGGSSDRGEGYDLLLYDDRAVYGYCIDAQKSDSRFPGEELFVWMDSDINGYCVASLHLMEDGRLCAIVEDWMNDDRVIVMLERTRAEQAPRREELVLVTVDGGSDLAAMAVKFNRGNSQYHLTVKNYESLTDLYNAVLTKEPMDLIDLSGVNVKRLASRGFFEDLAPYVDRSERFGPSDFVDGILDVYTYDDILVGIPAEFMIRTVVGRESQLDNKRGLTLEEIFSIADRYPGAKAFDGVAKDEVMQYLMMFNEDTFIDWDTGTCRFESEEFQAVLEYVSQFPDSAGSAFPAMAGRGEEESLSVKIQRGEVLFAIADLYPPFILQDYVKMFGEDAACIGFPTADGKGGHLLFGSDAYAIATVSERKEGAWNFIEETLTREKEGEIYAELWIAYPSLKKALDEKAERAVAREELIRDDMKAVLDLLPDATPFFSVKEDEIIKIISEEAPAYYNGQKGLEDVAGIIQNRIKLYVDENR